VCVLLAGNELTGDPKCWLCAVVCSPGAVYEPLICAECMPSYLLRSFVFVRASENEIKELFPC
jgi:hypothetical protein